MYIHTCTYIHVVCMYFMYVHTYMYIHVHTCTCTCTVEPGEKTTHLDRPPDLKISPIFVLRQFMKSFRCELCAWGTLNMSGYVEKNASVFLVCKVVGFYPFMVVYRFSGPVLCQKNILGCSFRYFHWECCTCTCTCTSMHTIIGILIYFVLAVFCVFARASLISATRR